MRFGESFKLGADSKNRMDSLKNQEDDQNIPEYILFGKQIRDVFKDRIDRDGWPEIPNYEKICSAEDFFEAAKSVVSKNWDAYIQDIINTKASDWALGIKENSREAGQARELLNNPDELKLGLELRQFGVLEILRKCNQNAWRDLLVASSERQLASIAVMKKWINNSQDGGLEKIFNKIGLSPAELNLFVDTAAILGKYVDQAYIKQVELADLPGGSEQTKLYDKSGSQFFYDLYKDSEGEELNIKTYSEMFPYEWPKIVTRLNFLARRTQKEVENNALPESFVGYGEYLKRMAQVYDSKTIDPEDLGKEWDELYAIAGKVDESGCPIMLICQGSQTVADEAEKVDIEMRLGLKTKEVKEREKDYNKFTKIGQIMLDNYRGQLQRELSVPAVSLSFQPWAFGPDLYWFTRGESSESQILSHTNAISEVAIARELPLVKKIMIEQEITDKDYIRASIGETVLHEIGHNVIDYGDKKVEKRIGGGTEVEIMEEIKADTVGSKILLEAAKRGELTADINIKNQLIAKLGGCFDYIKNKSSKKGGSGEPYFLSGVAIIVKLLDKGLLYKGDSGYKLGDYTECLKEIAAIGDDILRFYTDDSVRPADIKNYINKIRSDSKNKELRDLIENL